MTATPMRSHHTLGRNFQPSDAFAWLGSRSCGLSLTEQQPAVLGLQPTANTSGTAGHGQLLLARRGFIMWIESSAFHAMFLMGSVEQPLSWSAGLASGWALLWTWHFVPGSPGTPAKAPCAACSSWLPRGMWPCTPEAPAGRLLSIPLILR